MKKIILISCAAKKLKTKAKAQDLYISTLFKESLKYAYSFNPDKIYILSALYGLVELDTEIEPYNVTLSSKSNKNPELISLNKTQISEWGEKVINQLQNISNIDVDVFIFLAGQPYIKPLRQYIHDKNIVEPMKGLRLGERIHFLQTVIY
jgi:cytoplasmic iron level regulating protein YaaA (DUF328/UPF0246 family)